MKDSERIVRAFFDAVTAEEDRICAELHGHGALINGEPYENTCFFAFRMCHGRIVHVSEHFNALIVRQEMVPLAGAAAAS